MFDHLRFGALVGVLAGTLAAASLALPAAPASAAGRTFYVHCSEGSDSASGTSTSAPWRSISRANRADLRPGDRLLLRSGCSWNGQKLTARWNGTASAPVLIGSYGDGPRPRVRNGGNAGVVVTGSYQTIEDLAVTFDPQRTTSCGQPLGEYYGVVFNGGAHHNTLRGSKMSKATAGVHISKTAGPNTVVGNLLQNNNVLTTFGSNPALDLGAWGVLIRSSGNEVAHNTFRSNAAVCSNQGYKLMSNSVEIYEGSNNRIHHNRSFGDRVFSELGSSATKKASGNLFAYNLFRTNRADSRFIVTRGSGDAAFGPVRDTKVMFNTTYQTGQRSQAVVCILGCSSDILTVRSNILWAEEKIVYADRPFTLGATVAWNSQGSPVFQVSSSQSLSGVRRADPMFTSPVQGNFSLRAGSPAIDRADAAAPYPYDLARVGVPQNGRADQGGFEHRR